MMGHKGQPQNTPKNIHKSGQGLFKKANHFHNKNEHNTPQKFSIFAKQNTP